MAIVLQLNIRKLWVFLPLGLAAELFNMNPIMIAIFNFLAIIPPSERESALSDNLSDAFETANRPIHRL
jgi:Ca2+:H+ antiporter